MNKVLWWMEMAETTAKKSPDPDTKVGAILINKNTGAIIASGYNGFVRHAPDSILPLSRPDKYPYMIHAEQNLICNCARHGISMNDCFIVCTMSPCVRCMRYLWQCGIERIICKELYGDFEDIYSMADLDIKVGKIQSSNKQFITLDYSKKITNEEAFKREDFYV